jgi:hypothetical protein
VPEFEGRRHRAADKRPAAERAGGLPDAARHDSLRQLTKIEVSADAEMAQLMAIVAQRQFERRAGVVVKYLVGIDLVPCERSPAWRRK